MKKSLILILITILFSGCLENTGEIILMPEESQIVGTWNSNNTIFNFEDNYTGFITTDNETIKFSWRVSNGYVYFFTPSANMTPNLKFYIINNTTININEYDFNKMK